MKCDLHVHSIHSGACPAPVLRHFFLESYSAPLDVYQTLRARGMDLVTLTDHDAISGAEELRRFPNFFVSEEATCRMPSGTQVHIGVYDLSERQHNEIQARRNDLIRLLSYLSEQRLLYSINHVFSSLTGRRDPEDFCWFDEYFPAFEALNGQMLPEANRLASALARRSRKIRLAGSDAHALVSVGSAYTEVAWARDKEEFFAGLRTGQGRLCGESGSFIKLTRDILLLCVEMMAEKPCTVLLAPLVALVPAGVLVNLFREGAFVRRWSAHFGLRPAAKPELRPVDSRPAWEEAMS